jgi:hypothetical protein
MPSTGTTRWNIFAPRRVTRRDILGRRDDDRAVHVRRLHERQLRVAGARRHVDESIGCPQATSRRNCVRIFITVGAPDCRLVALDEEPGLITFAMRLQG